jgi:hypothetical protein
MRSRKLARDRASSALRPRCGSSPRWLSAALLSIPVGLVLSTIMKRRERAFKNGMKAAARVMNHRDFEQAWQEGRGTLMIESHSRKGPFRWWWTAESVYDLCPLPLVTWFMSMPNDERYRPLADWCRREYTNCSDGRALLVDLASPEGGFTIDRTAVGTAKMKWFEIAAPERLRASRGSAPPTHPASPSISRTASAESVKRELARSCRICSASEVPVSGSIPMARAKANTICAAVALARKASPVTTG